ncbi:hypothetical protein B296_00049574 [Ensete ventricosum]|uniref:Uncharacterized protein n=1 Tax=Ensete ventricosum TaxID=4639 RepID=A0A426YQ56_ENSVE|nr:hypothetical protein B296_00049574 [Ensete ventricosum]
MVCVNHTLWFSLLSGKALYRPVRTGLAADQYADRSLPGGTANIDRRRSILAIGDRLREKSIVGGRLRKKKGRGRRGKEERRKKKEEEKEKYLACAPLSPTGRSRAVAALVARG